MMINVSELEAIIAQAPPGEPVQYEAKPIGSVDYVTRKLTELKLSRSSDPDYLIFVGIDRFGECFLAPFSTIGDPLEFRARHERRLDRASERLFPPGMSRLGEQG
jgi:hypothetical protein